MSLDAGTLAASLKGQGSDVVGRTVTSAWFPGAHPITQGWGPSSYDGEPEGHGYAHWHAGVDVGLPCGTDLHMPAFPSAGPSALYGVARWVDNPGGYGTALRIELKRIVGGSRAGASWARSYDLWLGHLRQRLVKDGEEVGPGDHLAVSNNTGNSTGCHLHFEVRPPGGKYGTDVDPTRLLLTPDSSDPSQQSPSSDGNPYNPLDPRYAAWELEHEISGGITQAENVMLALGQAGLGTVLLVGGLAVVAYGLRGKNLGALRRDAVALATRPSRAKPPAPERPAAAPAETPARISRVRVTHQRELTRRAQSAGTDLSPAAKEAVHQARYGRGQRLSPEVARELRARPRFQPRPAGARAG